ncbi:MAG: hypothetical protein ACREJO_14580 [Phycisphaerales bacterium]
MAFSVENFHLAARDYRSHWRLADEQLYELCAQFPDHTRSDAVLAKLMIVGRTYATGLERAIGGVGALARITRHVCRHADQLDEIISSLDGVTEPLQRDSLNCFLRAESDLVRLLRGASSRHRGLHSFATKYLHFHRPIVPLYDSLAEDGLRRLYRGQRIEAPIDDDPDFDPIYIHFLRRWWRAYTEAVALVGPEAVSVKVLDYYLLVVAGATAPAPQEPSPGVTEA